MYTCQGQLYITTLQRAGRHGGFTEDNMLQNDVRSSEVRGHSPDTQREEKLFLHLSVFDCLLDC